MKMFHVSFLAPPSKLSTIVGAISGEVDRLEIKEVDQDDPTPRRSPHRVPGQQMHDPILKTVAVGATVAYADVQRLMEADGYAGTSASPTMSRLVKEGKFERIQGRKFKRLA